MSHTNRSYKAAGRQLGRGTAELAVRVKDDALLVYRLALLIPAAGLFIAAAFCAGGPQLAREAYELIV